MEKIRLKRKVKKMLEEYGVPNAGEVAAYWVNDSDRTDLMNENDKKTLALMHSILPISEYKNPMSFVYALMSGWEQVEATYRCLSAILLPERLEWYYRQRATAFSVSVEKIRARAGYLKSLELTTKQIQMILLDALEIGLEDCKARNDLVLRLFDNDKNFLAFLAAERGLYFPSYYSDIPEALTYIVTELGAEKSRILLIENELFLILYRRKEYRDQYPNQWKEVLEIIEKYR